MIDPQDLSQICDLDQTIRDIVWQVKERAKADPDPQTVSDLWKLEGELDQAAGALTDQLGLIRIHDVVINRPRLNALLADAQGLRVAFTASRDVREIIRAVSGTIDLVGVLLDRSRATLTGGGSRDWP